MTEQATPSSSHRARIRNRNRSGNRDRRSSTEGPQATLAPLLAEPRDGLTPVISTPARLVAYANRLGADSEPVALDAERASSYRYSARAYLVQIRSRAAGTALVDPLPFRRPPSLAHALADREWVLHAATQDLPCLSDMGLRPSALFDTELAARLLNMEHVGLGAVVEDTVGVRLAKEHAAVDWSRRPLDRDWLTYAALDVEVLLDVRDVLAQRLRDAGKDEWARQEFAWLVDGWQGPSPKVDPWRHLPGVAAARSTRVLGIARELWTLRDQIARERDLSPHLIINDRRLGALVTAVPRTRDEFRLAAPRNLPQSDLWWERIQAARKLPVSALPARQAAEGVPHQRTWQRRHPDLFNLFQETRTALSERADQLDVPLENLLTPAHLRTLLWEHPDGLTEDETASELSRYGARPWQVQLTAPVIAPHLDLDLGTPPGSAGSARP